MINYKIIDEFIYIKSDKLEIILSTIGASIYRLKIFNHDFLLSPDDKNEFLYSKGFYGKTLGPIAGRYNLKDYNKNINEDIVILHGDKYALSFKKFNYKIKQKDNQIQIAFEYKYNVKNDTFNGNNTKYKIIYIINNDKEEILLKHEIKAYEDTYASLSFHPYFVLSDNINCLSYKLKFKAMKRSIVKDNFLIDSFIPIDDGFNFSRLKTIKNEINKNPKLKEKGQYFLNKEKDIIIKDHNYQITIKSDYKDILMTINQLPIKTMFNNKQEEKYSALVIENEIAPNQKEQLFIKAKETKKHYIKYIFKKLSK